MNFVAVLWALWFQFVLACYVISRLLQIMAGDDSPTEKKEEFHFGRSTPPPTTSYVSASAKPHHDHGDITTAAEPHKEDKEKDKDKEKEKDDKDEIDVMRSDSHPSNNNPDVIRSKSEGEEEDGSGRRDKREDKDWSRDRDGPGKKVDGSDVLDGQWIPPKDTKHQHEDEEDDNCTVKCLYYTMQCCECSIS